MSKEKKSIFVLLDRSIGNAANDATQSAWEIAA